MYICLSCVTLLFCTTQFHSRHKGEQCDFIFRNNLERKNKDTSRGYRTKRSSCGSWDRKWKPCRWIVLHFLLADLTACNVSSLPFPWHYLWFVSTVSVLEMQRSIKMRKPTLKLSWWRVNGAVLWRSWSECRRSPRWAEPRRSRIGWRGRSPSWGRERMDWSSCHSPRITFISCRYTDGQIRRWFSEQGHSSCCASLCALFFPELPVHFRLSRSGRVLWVQRLSRRTFWLRDKGYFWFER